MVVEGREERDGQWGEGSPVSRNGMNRSQEERHSTGTQSVLLSQ